MDRPHIEGYILLEELRVDASGSVFAAVTNGTTNAASSQADLAVKVFSGSRAEQRFLRELQCLQVVRGHKNVVELIASCEGTPGALVMPLNRGLDLHALVKQHKGLPEVVAAIVMRDLLAATQHVHQCGVLHRNIKPENILVSDGRALLIDFDDAKQISSCDEPERVQVGTAGYMSPEMIARKPVGWASDLFSVGCTLFFMFKRKPPFRSTPHSEDAVFHKTCLCRLQFDVCFDDVSEACKSLISSLVVRRPTARLSSEQALQHEWLTLQASSDHSFLVACMSSSAMSMSSQQFSPPKRAVTAITHPQLQPSACGTNPSQSSAAVAQAQIRDSSDMQLLRTSQSSYVSRKPEPRRPSGEAVGPERLCFRKSTSGVSASSSRA